MERRWKGGFKKYIHFIIAKKKDHSFQSVHFPNSDHWTKPIGEMTFAVVAADLIVRFMTQKMNN